MCSIYEIIHSYRESLNSTFPGFNSPLAIDALNKLMEIKNEISSGNNFDIPYIFRQDIILLILLQNINLKYLIIIHL